MHYSTKIYITRAEESRFIEHLTEKHTLEPGDSEGISCRFPDGTSFTIDCVGAENDPAWVSFKVYKGDDPIPVIEKVDDTFFQVWKTTVSCNTYEAEIIVKENE